MPSGAACLATVLLLARPGLERAASTTPADERRPRSTTCRGRPRPSTQTLLAWARRPHRPGARSRKCAAERTGGVHRPALGQVRWPPAEGARHVNRPNLQRRISVSRLVQKRGPFRAVRNNARLCFRGTAWLCPSRPDSNDQGSGCPSGVLANKLPKCYLLLPNPSVIIFSWTDRFILFSIRFSAVCSGLIQAAFVGVVGQEHLDTFKRPFLNRAERLPHRPLRRRAANRPVRVTVDVATAKAKLRVALPSHCRAG